MMQFKSWLIASMWTCLPSLVTAQVVIPLSGDYRFGRVHALYDGGCGAGVVQVGAEVGLATMAPGGTYTYATNEHEVCGPAAITDSTSSGAGTYVVAADGRITFDPGVGESHVYPSRDLQVLAWAGDSAADGPHVSIAVRLSGGQADTSLFGSYHVARIGFAKTGTGTATSSESWSGSIQFNGSGVLSSVLSKKLVSATGATTFPAVQFPSGTYAVTANGLLTMSMAGITGTMEGAVTSDGSLFFVIDSSGANAGLIVGIRYSSGATAGLFDGTWRGGTIAAQFGAAAGLPGFCSNSLVATVTAATTSYTTVEGQVCETSAGGGTMTVMGGGTFSVNSNGSTCVMDAGTPPCGAGAVDPGGSYAFVVDLVSTATCLFSFHVRTPLPVLVTCPGDGSVTPCPCANESIPGSKEGCINSFGVGGKLVASGTPSLAADTFTLLGTQMPNSAALFFQGTTLLAGGHGAVFGDGLRCASGSVFRLGLKQNSGGASQYPAAGDATVSVRGMILAPGTRSYQIWYRNAALYCAPATFNLTNGLLVVWSS